MLGEKKKKKRMDLGMTTTSLDQLFVFSNFFEIL